MKARGGLIYQERLKALNPCSSAKCQLPGAPGTGLLGWALWKRLGREGKCGTGQGGVQNEGNQGGIQKQKKKKKRNKTELQKRSFLDNRAAGIILPDRLEMLRCWKHRGRDRISAGPGAAG